MYARPGKFNEHKEGDLVGNYVARIDRSCRDEIGSWRAVGGDDSHVQKVLGALPILRARAILLEPAPKEGY